MTIPRDRRELEPWLLAASGLAALALTLRVIGGAWPIDDAFITFRYARNLAAGLGLVYNANEFVLGTSTPLFAILLATLARISGAEISHLAVGICALADGVGTFLLCGIARRLTLPTPISLLCGLTWAFYPLSLKYAMGGMETSLVSLLLLGAFTAWLSRHDVWAMALAGAAVLTRPDAVAAAVTIAVVMTVDRRSLPWKPLLACSAVVVPWLLVAALFYGSPLPQSVLAKSHSIYRVQPLENARQIGFNLGGAVLGSPIGMAAQGLALSPSEEIASSLLKLSGVLLLLWVIGAVSAVKRDRRWMAVFAFPVVFAATYALLGLRGTLLAEWYLVPLMPFWLLGIFNGIAVLSDNVPYRWSVAIPLALCSMVAIAQIAGLNWGRVPGRASLLPLAIWTERENQYRQAVDYLRPRLRPMDLVAASEIGTIGYYCNCRVLDTVGLVSPEAIPYYPLDRRQYVINYAVPPDLIRDSAPDYLISLDVFIRKSLLEEDWFRRDYRIAWELDSNVFGSKKLYIFVRTTPRREGLQPL